MERDFKTEKRLFSYIILIVGLVSFLLVLLAAYFLFSGKLNFGTGIFVIAVGTLLALLARSYWSMKYRFKDRWLSVRGAFFTRGINASLVYRIPYEDITGVQHSKNNKYEGSRLISALKGKKRVYKKFITGESPKNVVISTNQEIHYFNRKMNMGYMVSPEKDAEFIKELKSRIPNRKR